MGNAAIGTGDKEGKRWGESLCQFLSPNIQQLQKNALLLKHSGDYMGCGCPAAESGPFSWSPLALDHCQSHWTHADTRRPPQVSPSWSSQVPCCPGRLLVNVQAVISTQRSFESDIVPKLTNLPEAHSSGKQSIQTVRGPAGSVSLSSLLY